MFDYNGSGGRGSGERRADDGLRLVLNAFEMFVTEEAFGVDFVNLLGSGRTRREPAIVGGHFNTADLVAVAGRVGQHLADRLSGELGRVDVRGRKFLDHGP